MKLTVQERLQFQYLLPVQGSFKTLELVEKIIQKVNIKELEEPEREFIFEIEEIEILQDSIKTLDQACKLSFQSLPVIRKIMEEII